MASGWVSRPVSRYFLVEDADYPRLCDIVNKNNRDMYRGYQKETTRPIEVLGLTPR